MTIAEAGWFAPDHVGVVVKESLTRFAAHHVHPVTARVRIMEAATAAVQAVRRRRLRPPTLPDDLTLEVDLQTADMAAIASWVKGVERSGTRSVRVTGAGPDPDGMAVYDAFVALTYITRQAGGR